MRKRRELRQGAEYHVTARINRGEMSLLPKQDKDLFLEVLIQAKRKYQFRISNFCVMNNHIHLMIKPGKHASLSKIMQWILSVFAIRWNRKHHLNGHVWGDRFFSRIISKVAEFFHIFSYLDENPAKSRLVKYPWQWEYGGLWYHKRGIFTAVDPPSEFVKRFFPEHILRPDI
ncbi:MAG: transposase [Spirochaetaceae bacterium]|nr:transposase [Spirochaetaceae bacterium]